jgi:hypothetical protein
MNNLNFTQTEASSSTLNCLSYLKNLLEVIRNNPKGTEMLIARVSEIVDALARGEDVVEKVIALISVLDRAYEAMENRRSLGLIGKAIAVAVAMMKQLGGKPLSAEVGSQFDCNVHCCVYVELRDDLPNGSITHVLSRGFRFSERIVYAQVVVAKNSEYKGNTGGVIERSQPLKERNPVKSEEEASPDCSKKPGRSLCKTTEQYRASVGAWAKSIRKKKETRQWVNDNRSEIMSVYALDFDPVIGLLESLYDQRKRGSDAFDPVAMIRSLLLLTQFSDGGITKWAKELRRSSHLAVLSGFSPAHTPSVAAFYKFLERLENGAHRPKCRHLVRLSHIRRARNPFRVVSAKPAERAKPNPNDGVLKKLVEQLKKEENEPIPNDLEKRLNDILLQVAIKPSAHLGLLSFSSLTISGDGSTVETQASHWGKRTCDCKKLGIYKCEHPRKFADLDAAWGWDTIKDDFVFGYRYYQFVTSDQKHDLPLYLKIGPCNTHEATMCVRAMERVFKQNQTVWPEAKIGRFVGDSIHDIYAVYHYFVDKKLRYAIPYAHEPSSCNYIGDKQIAVDEKGVPLCPGGLPMRLHGKGRHGGWVYSCPVKRITHRGGKTIYIAHRDECPFSSLCQPDSQLGPLAIVKPKDDPRICPSVPRNSQEYKELMNLRSGCERSNSMKKETYNMKYRKTRVMSYAFIMLAFISLLEHSRAWIAEGRSPAPFPI